MAKYRDDRDAQRDRADALERELSAAKTELAAKDAALAHRAAEVERLRIKAGERPPASAARSVGLVAGVLVAVAVAGATVGFVTFARSASAPPPQPVAPAHAPLPPPLPVPPDPAVPDPAGDPLPRTAIETHATFGARVTAVRGRSDVKVGDTCEIRVDASDLTGRVTFDEVVVRCRGVELHRMTQQGGTIVSMSTHALAPAPDDPENRYVLRYEDVGTRSAGARSQVAIDSQQRRGRVFTEGAAPTEVVLQVDERGRPVAAPRPTSSADEVVF